MRLRRRLLLLLLLLAWNQSVAKRGFDFFVCGLLVNLGEERVAAVLCAG